MPTDADRLAALERAVSELERDLAELRAATRAPDRAPAARPPAVRPPIAPTVPSVTAGAPGRASTPRPPSLRDRTAAYARQQAAGLGLPGTAASGPDLEAVIGRYGTVAVAALLILMGVGAFLTWAVATFTVTPATRVALGAVTAAAFAALGWRLRSGRPLRRTTPAAAPSRGTDAAEGEGTRRFGDLLLGLALAITHVDAWAAGPYLDIVPPAAALAVAATASAALATLAWRGRQQSLFVVGTGGALGAPFVTSAAPGHPFVLPTYGWLVIAASTVALRTGQRSARPWGAAAATLAVGCALYTAVQFGDASAAGAIGNPAGLWLPAWTLRRDAPALFALACAITTISSAASRRHTGNAEGPNVPAYLFGPLAVSHLFTTLGALVALALNASGGAPTLAALAFVATLATYGSLPLLPVDATRAHGRVRFARSRVGVAVLLPLGLLCAALLALPEAVGPGGAAVAASWSVTAAVAGWRALAHAPDHTAGGHALPAAHAAVAGIASATIPIFLLTTHDVGCVVLLALHAAAAAQLLRHVRHPLTLLAPGVVTSVAIAWAGVLLERRPAYSYPPFLTPESCAAGAVVFAWGVIAWRMQRDEAAVFPANERRLAVATAAGVALLWGRQELARAVSADVSTFLLIGYFAVVGIAAIAVGRARVIPAARRVGLGLALYAALKTLSQTSALDAVGLRVGSYLLVGGFLLGVGYWYRSAGNAPASRDATDSAPAPGELPPATPKPLSPAP